MKSKITPNNQQRLIGENDFIVSKTDAKGRIRYANRLFMNISGYPEHELLSMQHNIIRHPDMPRGVFHLMWENLKAGKEFFGFIKNLCADGSYYWVMANITPDFDSDNTIQGYYSVRRKAPQSGIENITPIYQEMQAIELNNPSIKEAPKRSIAYLMDKVQQGNHKDYDQFVLKLYNSNK